jgi:transposase
MATTSLQQRVMIADLSRQGATDSQIGAQLGISVYTVRKWRRRTKQQADTGSPGQMGRRPAGAMSTSGKEVVNALKYWRESHPGWGPKTLRAELARGEGFAGVALPSESVITRWLREQKLSRRYEKHRLLPAVCTSPAAAPHEEWELDARGYERIPDVGVISLLDVNDVFSKAKIMSYPCWLGQQRASRHPATEDYQMVLRLSFTEWGLPDRLAVDHDSVFYDNKSKSPFPTRFHLWLVALKVELTFGRMGQPRDQAMTERSHQTWQHQVLDGQRFVLQAELLQALNERRSFLNNSLPCATLGEVPPLLAHPQANVPRRIYRPEWETDLLDLSRVHDFLARGRWFRKASNVGAVSLGRTVYCLGAAWRRAEVDISFDANDRHLVFRSGEKEKRLPVRGIDVDRLMGDFGALAHLDAFQLALPFTWKEWRQIQIRQLLSDTTL